VWCHLLQQLDSFAGSVRERHFYVKNTDIMIMSLFTKNI